jgi:hypothetical protein
LEEVEVTIAASHLDRGDLEAYLTSPSGTRSRLMINSGADEGDNLNWTFTTNAFWGEIPQGDWQLQVIDTAAGSFGTLNSYQIDTRNGTLASLSVSATSLPAGNNVTCFWRAPEGSSAKDWVALFATGAGDRSYMQWVYTGGAATGQFTVKTPLTPGSFEFRYFLNNGYTRVATSPTVTTTAPGYSVTAAPSSVAPGGTISVGWTAPPGRPLNDWLGLFAVGASNRQYISWVHTGGAQSGNTTFTAPQTPGTYEIRYLLNDGYTDLAATSNLITVAP